MKQPVSWKVRGFFSWPNLQKYTHRIHGAAIFTHIYHKSQPFMWVNICMHGFHGIAKNAGREERPDVSGVSNRCFSYYVYTA